MEVIKKVYKLALNVGIYVNNKEEHKKIRLLNAFCLTWSISICFFLLLDPFFAQSWHKSIGMHSLSFLIIGIVHLLQKLRKYIYARVLFILTLIDLYIWTLNSKKNNNPITP